MVSVSYEWVRLGKAVNTKSWIRENIVVGSNTEYGWSCSYTFFRQPKDTLTTQFSITINHSHTQSLPHHHKLTKRTPSRPLLWRKFHEIAPQPQGRHLYMEHQPAPTRFHSQGNMDLAAMQQVLFNLYLSQDNCDAKVHNSTTPNHMHHAPFILVMPLTQGFTLHNSTPEFQYTQSLSHEMIKEFACSCDRLCKIMSL